jgi:hypothetical protein
MPAPPGTTLPNLLRDASCETRSGAPGTRPEPQAKTGSFLPETGPPVSGGRDAQDQRKNRKRPPRNPRASSGRQPTATAATRNAQIRERRHSDRGTHRGRGRLASATPLGVSSGEPARTSRPPLLLSAWRRGRASDSARGRSDLPFALGSGLGVGQNRRSGSTRRDRTPGRDRQSPPSSRQEPPSMIRPSRLLTDGARLSLF